MKGGFESWSRAPHVLGLARPRGQRVVQPRFPTLPLPLSRRLSAPCIYAPAAMHPTRVYLLPCPRRHLLDPRRAAKRTSRSVHRTFPSSSACPDGLLPWPIVGCACFDRLSWTCTGGSAELSSGQAVVGPSARGPWQKAAVHPRAALTGVLLPSLRSRWHARICGQAPGGGSMVPVPAGHHVTHSGHI